MEFKSVIPKNVIAATIMWQLVTSSKKSTAALNRPEMSVLTFLRLIMFLNNVSLFHPLDHYLPCITDHKIPIIVKQLNLSLIL